MSEEIRENVAQMDDDEKYLPANPWISAIPTLLAVFIYVIDGTIANVALPIWQEVSLLLVMRVCGF